VAKEIEYKFLVKDELIPREKFTEILMITQGYLSDKPNVRVRISNTQAYLTVKSKGMVGRDEFEYEVPLQDAIQMMELCPKKLKKTRCIIPINEELKWEIDYFEDGLVLAEIEVPYVDYNFDKPEWLGEDVSHVSAYKNVNLAK
jgi:adenylate cyclase